MVANDGGPAFPCPGYVDPNQGTLPDGDKFIEGNSGLSLRDWFAAKEATHPPKEWVKAMTGRDDISYLGELSAVQFRELLMKWRYQCADSMLAARKS